MTRESLALALLQCLCNVPRPSVLILLVLAKCHSGDVPKSNAGNQTKLSWYDKSIRHTIDIEKSLVYTLLGEIGIAAKVIHICGSFLGRLRSVPGFIHPDNEPVRDHFLRSSYQICPERYVTFKPLIAHIVTSVMLVLCFASSLWWSHSHFSCLWSCNYLQATLRLPKQDIYTWALAENPADWVSRRGVRTVALARKRPRFVPERDGTILVAAQKILSELLRG